MTAPTTRVAGRTGGTRTRTRRSGLVPLDRPRIEGLRIIGGYSGVIVLAELLGALWSPLVSAVIDGALIPVLLAHFALRHAAAYRRLLPVLALLALLRTLSVAAVFPHLPVATWYLLVGAPVLIGAVLAARLIDEPFERLGLRVRDIRLDAEVTLLGVPASLLGYLLLRPAALMPGAPLALIVLEMAVLAVFAAFTEELVYRGLLQTVAIEAFGLRRAGVVYAATMCAIMYLGAGSVPFTVAMWALAFGYGQALLRGSSLWGLAASHTLILWGMAFVWPIVLG
jgi:membrane protease YdiL (CAAX protease family)